MAGRSEWPEDRSGLRSGRSVPKIGILLLMSLLSAGCTTPPTMERTEAPTASSPAESSVEQMLIGYDLLANALREESRLSLLGFVKKVTLRGPVEEVGEIISALSTASKARAKELKELRSLEPDVSAKPAQGSAIGEAINDVVVEVGKHEMLDREGPFDIRFVLLQAQATRMIAAMATAIARFETNSQRKAWLGEVAAEYEGYREDIIEVVQTYVDGKGAAQLDEIER